MQRRVKWARPRELKSTKIGKGLCGVSGSGTPTKLFIAVYRRHD